MRILSKYILKEISPLFVISNAFVIFILLFEKLVDLASLFFAKNVGGLLILETIVFYIPSFLVISIPISSLIAPMVAFSRFSADSELVAMRASGASDFWLLKITSLTGFFFFLISLIVSVWLMPLGNELSINNLRQIARHITVDDIKENEIYSEIPGLLILTKRKLNKNSFENIIIYKESNAIMVTAENGRILPTGEGSVIFELKNGEIISSKSEGVFTKIIFHKFLLNLETNIDKIIASKDERLMKMSDLRKNFDKGNIYKFEYSKRFALPFSALIMTVFGMILGSFFVRGGKSANILGAFVVIFSYNLLLIFSENIAKTSYPFLSAWYGNICFVVVTVFFYKRFKI